MQDFKDLRVWQKAHAWILKLYESTKSFPQDERYGITSQLRRASLSVPTNIAEGAGRSSNTEFARYLDIALSSASEVQYLLILARDLGYLPPATFQELSNDIAEIKRMATGLLKKLRPQTVN